MSFHCFYDSFELFKKINKNTGSLPNRQTHKIVKDMHFTGKKLMKFFPIGQCDRTIEQ